MKMLVGLICMLTAWLMWLVALGSCWYLFKFNMVSVLHWLLDSLWVMLIAGCIFGFVVFASMGKKAWQLNDNTNKQS